MADPGAPAATPAGGLPIQTLVMPGPPPPPGGVGFKINARGAPALGGPRGEGGRGARGGGGYGGGGPGGRARPSAAVSPIPAPFRPRIRPPPAAAVVSAPPPLAA